LWAKIPPEKLKRPPFRRFGTTTSGRTAYAHRLPARLNLASVLAFALAAANASGQPPTVSNMTSSRRDNDRSQGSISTAGRPWLPGQACARPAADSPSRGASKVTALPASRLSASPTSPAVNKAGVPEGPELLLGPKPLFPLRANQAKLTDQGCSPRSMGR
jgi:hypothetical protein